LIVCFYKYYIAMSNIPNKATLRKLIMYKLYLSLP